MNVTMSFVSICDSNYISRFLVMLDSLRENLENPQVFVLALDDFTECVFERLKDINVRVISLTQLNSEFSGKIEKMRESRDRKEFIFSLTPYLIQYLAIKANPNFLVYVDADIYFQGSPLQIMNTNDAVVGIYGHSFGKMAKHLEIYGKYNVGIVYFKNDHLGLGALEWWAIQCYESTSLDLRLNPEVFGDQKYLDYFADNFDGVYTHEGYSYGKGPWNSPDLSADLSSRAPFFFHFSGLEISKNFAILGYRAYSFRPTRATRNFYKEYISKVKWWDVRLAILQDKRRLSKPFKEWLKVLKYLDFVLIR